MGGAPAAGRPAPRATAVPGTRKPPGAEPSAARSVTIRRICARSKGSDNAVAICSADGSTGGRSYRSARAPQQTWTPQRPIPIIVRRTALADQIFFTQEASMQHARPRGFMASACLVLLVGVLAGCGGSSSSSSGGSSGSGGSTTGHLGGTMVLAWNGIGSSIDPAVDYDQNWTLLNLIYDGLVTWKKVGGSDGNTLVPDLAQQIPQATDGGKTYLFHLRSGISYSDGTAVKASDFVRAIEREFTIPGPVGSFYQGIVGGDACAKSSKNCDLSKGIVADDAAVTVTFHLVSPVPDSLQKLALPFASPVPAKPPHTGL